LIAANGRSLASQFVIPAQAGIALASRVGGSMRSREEDEATGCASESDSGLRRNDGRKAAGLE
jgi:hypothetical protein